MINKGLVKVIDFWQATVWEKGLLPRQLVGEIDVVSKEVVDITGPRRSGKSTVMKLLIQKLPEKENSLFINFEDPFFLEHNSPLVIEELIETYTEYFKPGVRFLFFDEIQNIVSWEKAVRKLRDSGNYKIFLSGSSAKLLSSEFATLLTGRHISYRLLPLSFIEYLLFKGLSLDKPKDLIIKEVALYRHFTQYLSIGGFPAVVMSQNQELLKQYYTDMVQRDIIRRYEVREREILEKMGVYLLTNSAKLLSLASLSHTYDLSHAVVSTYVEYFKEAFLIFDLPQFAYSLKRQQKAFKKIYAIDTGLSNSVSFRFSQDKGQILETCVFLALKRTGKEIYYYKTDNDKEVDFIVKAGNEKLQMIQVAWDIIDAKTRRREINALFEAMAEQKLTEGLLLTYDSTETVSREGKHIRIKPVYRWLLEK